MGTFRHGYRAPGSGIPNWGSAVCYNYDILFLFKVYKEADRELTWAVGFIGRTVLGNIQVPVPIQSYLMVPTRCILTDYSKSQIMFG